MSQTGPSRSHPTTPLADLLPKAIQDLKADSKPSFEAIRDAWRRLAGDQAARHSWPRKWVRGQLLVEVENSGWMYTLNLKKERLLQGLIEFFGAGQMKGLCFRLGESKSG